MNHKMTRVTIRDSSDITSCFQALLVLVLEMMMMVLGSPAQDRPAKQRDYAQLSHPANVNTVYAKVTVEKAVPLNSYRS